jgi:hypothetical protein
MSLLFSGITFTKAASASTRKSILSGMKTETKPMSEISRRATHILFKEMGVVDTVRFLNLFTIGQGDYTKEREKWLGDISLEDAISKIKAGRIKAQSD